MNRFRSDDFVNSVPVYSFFFLSSVSFRVYIYMYIQLFSLHVYRARLFDSKQASRKRVSQEYQAVFHRRSSSLSSSLRIQYVAGWDADHVK